MGEQGAADLGAGRVAMGVQNAVAAVRALAGEQQLAGSGLAVEAGVPLKQLVDARGALRDEDMAGNGVDEAGAGADGVFGMLFDISRAAERDGDAALGVAGVGLPEALLGDEQDVCVVGEADGGAKTGDACADDDESGPDGFPARVRSSHLY